jgi:4-diphosphocytidyl-2-C-methyl-D-erythritol kinase
VTRPPSCRLLAHAKLNLSLTVLAREAAGFHQLETLFCALELADEVEVWLGAGADAGTGADAGATVALEVAAPPEELGPPPDLGPTERNLALRAAVAFHRATGTPAATRIRLVKRVPPGGGLGGGSTDAAAVLRALNRLHDEPLGTHELLALGASLGSDVPFFLAGAALARGGGRGGRLMPLPPLPSAPVVLALPPSPVSTPAAYAALATTRGADWVAPPAVLVAAPSSWDDIRQGPGNDFEDVVFREMPLLRELRDALHENGAVLARMTGTGSTVYGVFADEAAADRARDRLAGDFATTRIVLTRTLAAIA